MSFSINSASPASSGATITKDPAYEDGMNDETQLIGGSHDALSGLPSFDLQTTRRQRRVKFVALTNTQWKTNVRPYLVGGTTLWTRFPHESSDFKCVIREAFREKPSKLMGDSATAPHWDVEFTLDEVPF